nr:zinc finger, CCHC-type [Tanacetum cinerariifolium]
MLHMKEDEIIDTFTKKLTTLVNKAASLGHTIEDQTLVRKLLNAVTDRYLQVVASIEQYSDLSEMTMEEAIERLKTYEERIKYKKGKQVDNQEKLMFTRHESKGKYFRGRGCGKHRFSQGKSHKNLRKRGKMENPLIGILIETTSRNQAMILANYNVTNEDEIIDTFTRKLTTLVNKEASLGHIIEDQTIVHKLLNVVPDRYLQIVASIEQYSDLSEMTMEEAIGRLKTYEERIKYKKDKAYCTKLSSKDKVKEKSNLVKEDLEPTLLMAILEDSDEGNQVKEVEEQKVSLHEEDVGYKETNMDSQWYLDNGASNHMTGVREHFKELDEKVSGKVRFGDGSYIKIKGKVEKGECQFLSLDSNRDGKPLVCCKCEGPLRGGFCWFCASNSEIPFNNDPNPISFDDSQNLSDYSSQPQYETYLCELCGNDSHYGYDCPPQCSLVYDQEPCYNQNYNENYYPYNLLSFFVVTIQLPQRSNDDIQIEMAKLIKNNRILLNNNTFHHEETKLLPQLLNDSRTIDEMLKQHEQAANLAVQQEQEEQVAQSFTPYWNFSMIDDEEVLQAREKFLKAIQTFLQKFSRYSFGVMPKVLLIAWERFFEIKHAFTDKQYQPEEIQELMCKLLEDLQIIKHSIQYKEYLENSSNAITTVLPTEEPECSLSIGYEHLSTILETESDEVIKYSAKNLVQISSEYEVTSDDEKDVPMENFKVYSNLLFDDEEIIFNKIDPHYINAESDLIESLSNRDTLFDSSPKFDYLEEFSGEFMPTSIVNEERIKREHEEYISLMEKLLSINSFPCPLENFHAYTIIETLPTSPIPVENGDSLREEIDIFTGTDDLTPPVIESDDYDSERDIHFLEELLNNDSISLLENESSNFDHHDDPSFPRPPSEPPDVEVFFDFEPNELISVVMSNIDELNEDKCFDPGGGEIDVFANIKDDDYFPFIFVIRIFLPYLTYPEVSPLLLSAKSKDTIFDPVIS